MSTDWMERAACLKVDPELMFPHNKDKKQQERATAICAPCTVRPECLGHALRTGDELGVWGGLTERQRKSLRRKEAKGVAA